MIDGDRNASKICMVNLRAKLTFRLRQMSGSSNVENSKLSILQTKLGKEN